MQPVKFRYDVAHCFDAPVDQVAAFFGDPVALAGCTPHVAAFESIEPFTVDYTLETQRDLGLEFTPRYRLRYRLETPRTLVWHTTPFEGSNVAIEARLQFSPLTATTCRVAVEEHVEFALPVTFVTAKIVQVIAKRQSAADMLAMLRAAEGRLRGQTLVEIAT